MKRSRQALLKTVLSIALFAIPLVSQSFAQEQVFRSDGTESTWDPIFSNLGCPAIVPFPKNDSNWQRVAWPGHHYGTYTFQSVNDYNMDGGTPWVTIHPWQFHSVASTMPDAKWINAWEQLGSGAHGIGGGGSTHYTKYEKEINGSGVFDLKLLGDNCTWVYLDEILVGAQLLLNDAQTYTLSMSGTHTLTFIIYDGGGLAGGMYELKTSSNPNLNPDRDGDGIPNDAESNIYGTDPDNSDSDGDGFSDGEEVEAGTDPNDSTDSPIPPDADGDGVLDEVDMCITDVGSFMDETVPLRGKLGENRWALLDNGSTPFNGLFTQGSSKKDNKGKGDAKGRDGNLAFSIADTRGCNCEQIIEAQGLGNGHRMHGCSTGEMREWIELVNPEAARKAEFIDEIRIADVPTEFVLEGNHPNPFNPQTTISFSVPQTAHVTLSVFDMLGREVQVLVNGTVEAGAHNARFNAESLPSGMYLYRLTTPTGVHTKMMQLIK